MSSDEQNGNDGNQPPALGATGRDRIVSGMRAFAGMAPVIGPILSEVIGELIPQQRQERLEAYVKALEERIEHLEKGRLNEKMRKSEKINLFEEGALQASRSLTQERIEYIAEIVASGIDGEEKEEIEAKRLLAILAELADDQIIRLASYLHKNHNDEEFRKRHADILDPVDAHLQSSRDELDRAALREAAHAQLSRLGLLKPRFKKPKSGEVPEFDENTGMIKSQGYDLTPLGRLLLRYVGLASPDDM